MTKPIIALAACLLAAPALADGRDYRNAWKEGYRDAAKLYGDPAPLVPLPPLTPLRPLNAPPDDRRGYIDGVDAARQELESRKSRR